MLKNLKFGVAILSLVLASGCLFESTIDASGGGTMVVSYMLKKDADLSKNPDMTSNYVEVTEATQAPDGMGTFHLKVKDFTKLSTAKFFREATITRTVDAEKGTTSIHAKIKHARSKKIPDAIKKQFGDQLKFVTTVPGEITETNATSKDGKTATWVFTMDEYHGATEIPLDVTYKNPS